MKLIKKGCTMLGGMLVTVLAGTTTALADGNPLSGISTPTVSSSGPGTGIYRFIMPQIVPLFLLFLGAMAVWYFVRHQHTKLVTLVIAATVVLVILTEPQAIGPFISWVGQMFQKL